MTQSNIFFFKAFESNYNSLSLIKLVPPHHSVMFFLATPQLEELLVFVSPQRDAPFCLIAAGQTDHQHQCCCTETKWCGEKSGKCGWGCNASTQEPWLWPSTLVWRKRKKASITETFLIATDLEYCCCCCGLLKTTSFFYLNFCSYTVLAFCLVPLFWVPVCWMCYWQCQTDRKVNALRWANLVLTICTCTHKCATLLLSPGMTDCSYKNH